MALKLSFIVLWVVWHYSLQNGENTTRAAEGSEWPVTKANHKSNQKCNVVCSIIQADYMWTWCSAGMKLTVLDQSSWTTSQTTWFAHILLAACDYWNGRKIDYITGDLIFTPILLPEHLICCHLHSCVIYWLFTFYLQELERRLKHPPTAVVRFGDSFLESFCLWSLGGTVG